MNLTVTMRLPTAAHVLFRRTLYHAPIDASYIVDINYYCNGESHFKIVSYMAGYTRLYSTLA